MYARFIKVGEPGNQSFHFVTLNFRQFTSQIGQGKGGRVELPFAGCLPSNLNRPFYSFLLSDLAIEWQRGWR